MGFVRLRREGRWHGLVCQCGTLYEYAKMHREDDQAESIKRRINKLTEKARLAKHEAAATLLGQHGECNPKIVRLRRMVKSGERLINREHIAQLRLEEKVRRLAMIPAA